MKSNAMKRATCVLAIPLHLAACTSLNTLPYTPEAMAAQPVREGERVVLRTKGSDSRHFIVTSVTPERICGPNECVATETIESVTREEVSMARTLGIVLLVAAGLGILVSIAHGLSGAGATMAGGAL